MKKEIPFIEPTEKDIQTYTRWQKIYFVLFSLVLIGLAVGSLIGSFYFSQEESKELGDVIFYYFIKIILTAGLPLLCIFCSIICFKDALKFQFKESDLFELKQNLTLKAHQKEKFNTIIHSKQFWLIQWVNFVVLGRRLFKFLLGCILTFLGYILLVGLSVIALTEVSYNITEIMLNVAVSNFAFILIQLFLMVAILLIFLFILFRNENYPRLIVNCLKHVLALFTLIDLLTIEDYERNLEHEVIPLLLVFLVLCVVVRFSYKFTMKKLKMSILGSKEKETEIYQAVIDSPVLPQFDFEETPLIHTLLPVPEWQAFVTVAEIKRTQKVVPAGLSFSKDGLIVNSKQSLTFVVVTYKLAYSWLSFPIGEPSFKSIVQSASVENVIVANGAKNEREE